MWFSAYLLVALALWGYSYGFTDLNLTLSSHPFALKFISTFQNLVYFHRQQSLWTYLALIVLAYLCYGMLYQQWQSKGTFPWKKIGVLALICTLAYPFLSHDVFKYLFSARMVVDYGLNPHTTSPDMVPGTDLWLRFMRWINTPSPYGPVMTALAIPYYLLGLKKLTMSLLLFKLDQLAWYAIAILMIGNIARVLGKTKKEVVRAQLFFALNPLVLVEWLANAHNDAPMIALLLISIYLLAASRRLLATIALALSIGIKYVTVLFVPFLASRKPRQRITLAIRWLYVALAVTPLLYRYQGQFQPWYVTWLVPFAALMGNHVVLLTTAVYTLGGLLRYAPFVATGLWSATQLEFALLTFGPLLAYLVYTRVRAALV